MALFDRKQQLPDSLPLYTLGAERTILMIGLGNPGKKYDGTRHNVGFAALDLFAIKNEFPKWQDKKDFRAEITHTTLGQTRVILIKPATYMNHSGQAARTVQSFYKLTNPQTLAVYDELALPFGQLRTRVGGSDAGHNGVKSLIEHLGEGFGRLRIGIGSPQADKQDSADFVLAKFSKAEAEHLPMILREVNVLMTEFLFGTGLAEETRKVL